MRFTCSRTRLADILTILTDVIPSRSAKPVLQNIQLSGNDDGTITLSATDLEISISYNFTVENLQEPEIILLPAAIFAGIVRDDWSENIELVFSNSTAEIITGSGSLHISGSTATDFPAISVIDKEQAVTINGDDITGAVHRTLFAAARGDTRYALNGIFLSIDTNYAEFVASDTHRLSLVKKKIKNPGSNKRDAIVITKGMSTLARLSAGQEHVLLQLTDRELIAKTTVATLAIRLVDGQFPRYQDVIPREMEKEVTVDKETLIKTLRLAGQMTNNETHSLIMSAHNDKVLITASGTETGDANLEFDAEIKGDNIAVAFNYIYLLDVLRVIDGKDVTISFKDSDSPARINAPDFIHIIMPIKAR